MRLDGAFGALLLLLTSGACTGILPPPTDLTVSCNNLNVTAHWKYRKQHPNIAFRVDIPSDPGIGPDNPEKFERYTTDQHFDLSPFLWSSEWRYMQVHYVTVTAILGRNQSIPAQSDTFTYNELKTSKLAFPEVNLKVDGSQPTVTFRNPFHHYKDLQQANKSESPYFDFRVTTADNKSFEGQCLVNQENCQREISFTVGEEQCVTLTGRLYESSGVRYVDFNKTDPICVDTSADLYVIVLITLLSVAFVAASVITYLVCSTKSWTMKKEEPNRPSALELLTDSRKLYFPEQKEDYCTVTLITKDTCRSPSVSSEEDDLQDKRDRKDSTSGSEAHSNCGYEDGGILENSNHSSSTDDNSVNDSMKTESLIVGLAEKLEDEEDEEEDVEDNRSPYDCPHSLPLDK